MALGLVAGLLASRQTRANFCHSFLNMHGNTACLRSMAPDKSKQKATTVAPFALDDAFCRRFEGRRGDFGYDGLGEFTFYRTYARKKAAEGEPGTLRYERWDEVIRRAVEGAFRLQQRHCARRRLPYSLEEAQRRAQAMYECFFEMRALPPGRGLWAMGTPITEERDLHMALFNCAFVSTDPALSDCHGAPWRPFCFIADALMAGSGVGFDTRGAGGKIPIFPPRPESGAPHVVADSRQGWVKSIEVLLRAYVQDSDDKKGRLPTFDYGRIRPRGTPLKAFGGVASGSGPLRELHEEMVRVMDGVLADAEMEMRSAHMTARAIVDLANLIGRCVVSANVRRSSEIAIGFAGDAEFMDLKDAAKFPERQAWSHLSNNSVVAPVGSDASYYLPIAERIVGVGESSHPNGEPGVYWLENAQRHGRMNGHSGSTDGCQPDPEALGSNPCVTGDTIVDTTDGPKRVDELIGKPFVAVVNGQERRSSDRGFFASGVKPVFLLTAGDGLTVKLTADHKVLVRTGPETETFVPASELTPDDRVALNNLSGDGRLLCGWMYSLTAAGEEPVYDCTIDDIHRFSANGIIVANCGEIALHSFELCNLAEIFVNRCTDRASFLQAARHAFLYAKSVSLSEICDWPETDRVQKRNRRTGVSLTGIAQFIAKRGGTAELRSLMEEGYRELRKLDGKISDEWQVPRSVRRTTTKPSGSVSLLGGATPGVHHPVSRYYIRRVRISSDSPLLPVMQGAGYRVEPDVCAPDTTSVVEFPIDSGEGVRSVEELSIWEQMALVAFVQRHWSDNMVSATVQFDAGPDEPASQPKRRELSRELASALELYQWQLKGITFLSMPRLAEAARQGRPMPYAQMPYEPIDADEYAFRVAELRTQRPDFASMRLPDPDASARLDEPPEELQLSVEGAQFCDGDACELKAMQRATRADKPRPASPASAPEAAAP